MIPYAPWCRPRLRQIGPGVEVMTVYGYHVLAALLHLAFVKVGLARAAQEDK
jgi:hypothetical protein